MSNARTDRQLADHSGPSPAGDCPLEHRQPAEADREAATTAQTVSDDLATALAGHVVINDTAGNGRADVIPVRIRQLVECGADPASIAVLAGNRRPTDLLTGLPSGVGERLVVGSVRWFLLRALRTLHSEAHLPSNFFWLDTDAASFEVGLFAEKCRLAHRQAGHVVAYDLLAMSDLLTACPWLTVEQVVRDRYPRFRNHEAAVRATLGEYERCRKNLGCVNGNGTEVLMKLVNALRTSSGAQDKAIGGIEHILIDCGESLSTSSLDCISLIAGVRATIFAVANDVCRFDRFLLPRRDSVTEISERLRPLCCFQSRPSGRRHPKLENVLNVLRGRPPAAPPLRSTTASPGPAPTQAVACLRVCANDASRAEDIVSSVRQLVKRGTSLSEQAVLCFDVDHTFGLQRSLVAAGTPFRVVGPHGVDRISHVRDLLSLLRIVANHRDIWAWKQALRLTTKLGENAIVRLIVEAKKWHTLESALTKMTDLSAVEFPRHHKRVADFTAALRRTARLTTPRHQFDCVLSFIESMLERRYKDRTSDRLRELDAMRESADTRATLIEFLDQFDANPTELRSNRRSPIDGVKPTTTLTLSTAGAGRGQEWAVVHVLLPSVAYLDIPSDAAGPVDDTGDVRATLYSVAARATRHLTFYLCRPHDRKLEIPGNVLTEVLTIRRDDGP